jgi:hypothetical protein
MDTLHSDSQVSGDGSCDEIIVTAEGRLNWQLERFLGKVADFDLQRGRRISGVLGAASDHAVVIEEWDALAHRPNGNPLTIALAEIVRITIP